MTVSAALHGTGAKSIRVSQETTRRIREIAKEMDYRPNAVARSLKSRCTNVIGFYTGADRYASGGTFLNDIVCGLRDGCDADQKDLLIHHQFTDYNPQKIFKSIVDGRIEGLVIWTQAEDPVARLFAGSSLPVIAIADPVDSLPAVVCDDFGAGEMIAKHLFQKGHRHIAFRQSHLTRLSAQVRQNSIEAAAAHLGMTVSLIAEGRDDQVTPDEQAVLFSQSASRPSAVVCWNDRSALALLKFCLENNIAVPQFLAIVGYDGVELMPPWRLTTILAPWVTVAHRAVELVITHTNKESIPLLTTIPVQLIEGNTT